MCPFGDVLADDRGIETPSVVGDRQDDPVALSVQPDADGRRSGMFVDVGEQFTGRPVQQLLRSRLTDVFELGLHGEVGASLELPQQFSHRRREPELGKHLRMQLGDGRAQAGRGVLQRRRPYRAPDRDCAHAPRRVPAGRPAGSAADRRAGARPPPGCAARRPASPPTPAGAARLAAPSRAPTAGPARSTTRSSRPPATQEAKIDVHHVRHPDVVVALRVEDPHGEIARGRDGSEDRGERRAGPRMPPRSAAGRTPAAGPPPHRPTPGTVRAPPVCRRPWPPSPPTGHGPAQHDHQPHHRGDGVDAQITAYSAGSQWSTSQIHTSTAIRPISGSRSNAETRTGSAAK